MAYTDLCLNHYRMFFRAGIKYNIVLDFEVRNLQSSMKTHTLLNSYLTLYIFLHFWFIFHITVVTLWKVFSDTLIKYIATCSKWRGLNVMTTVTDVWRIGSHKQNVSSLVVVVVIDYNIEQKSTLSRRSMARSASIATSNSSSLICESSSKLLNWTSWALVRSASSETAACSWKE